SRFPPPLRSTLFPYTTLFRSLLTAQAVEMFSALVSHDGSGGKAARMYPGTSARAGNVALAQSPIVQFCLPGIKGLQSASAKVLRSEEHTSELQSRSDLVCRLL